MRSIARWLAAGALAAAPLVFAPAAAGALVVEGGTLTVPLTTIAPRRIVKRDCAPARPAREKAAPRVGRVLLATDTGVRPA